MFDFIVKYKKGLGSNHADGVSRLQTFGETETEIGDEILRMYGEVLRTAEQTHGADKRELPLGIWLIRKTTDIEHLEELEPISKQEIVREQYTDHLCKPISSRLHMGRHSPSNSTSQGS